MSRALLQDGERIDDLLAKDLRIIQSDKIFSFSLDAVLLARFCSVPPKGEIIDLCTGNGVIPLLLSSRTRANIHGVEIQEKLADMAVRSVQLNRLTEQITINCRDLRQIYRQYGSGKFDLVTVNPPYMPVQSGQHNDNIHVALAKYEIMCNLEEVIRECSQLVRPGGKVAIVHKPARLIELISLLRRYHLEPKRIRFIHPRINEEANRVLIESSKDGKPEVRLLPPLIAHQTDGQYCEELLDIFYGRSNKLSH